VVGRDRSKAARADRADAGTLRLYACASLLVVGAHHDLLLAGAYLNREGPLAGLGKQLLGIEAIAHLAGKAQPV
jgi:hypothetical protein